MLLVKPACALAQEGISREERSPSRSLIEDFNAGLGAATSYTISDSVVVSGGYNETGSLVFTVTGPDGVPHSKSQALSGNNAYTASYTLPTAGMVAGTYTFAMERTHRRAGGAATGASARGAGFLPAGVDGT